MKIIISLFLMLNFIACMEIEEVAQDELNDTFDSKNVSCLPNSVARVDCTYDISNSAAASLTKICSNDGKSFVVGNCVASACAQGFKLNKNACVPQKCLPRQVTQIDCSSNIINSQTAIRNLTCNNSGNNYFSGKCELVSCKEGYYKDGSVCRPTVCKPNSREEISCKNAYSNAKAASFTRICDNKGKSFRDGGCTLNSCLPGYIEMNGGCRPQICIANQTVTESCVIENAVLASRTMSCNATGTGKTFGACLVNKCADGFLKRGNICVATSCSPNSSKEVQCNSEIVGAQSAIKIQRCNSSGTSATYSSCSLKACLPGYYNSGNSCIKQTCSPSSNLTVTCQSSIPNALSAVMLKTCNAKGTGYGNGKCNLVNCANGYVKQGNSCLRAQCSPNSQTLADCSSEVANASEAVKIIKCDGVGSNQSVGECKVVNCSSGFVKQGNSCAKTQCTANLQRVSDCTSSISNAVSATQKFICNSTGSSESASRCLATQCVEGYSVSGGLCLPNVSTGPGAGNDPGREPGGDPVNPAIAVSAPPYVPKIHLSGIKQGSSITNVSSTDFRPLFIPEGYGSLVVNVSGSYDISQNSNYDHKADNIEIYSDKLCTKLLLNIDLSNTQGSASQGRMNFSKRVFIPEQSDGAQFLFVKAKNSKGSSSCSSKNKESLYNVGSQPYKYRYPLGSGVIYNVRGLNQQSGNSRLNTVLNMDSSKLSLSHLTSNNFDLGEINGEKTVVLKKKIDKSNFDPLPWDTMSRDGSVVVRSVEQLNNAQNHIACQVLERVGSKLEFKQLITHENSINQYVTKQQDKETPFVTSRCYDVSDDGSMIIVQHTFDTCLNDDIEAGKVPCDIANTKIEIYMKDNSERWVSTHNLHPKLKGSGDQNGTWDKKKAFMGTRLVPTFSEDNNTVLLTAEYMYSKQLTPKNMNKIGAAYIFKKSGSSYSQTLEVIGNRDLSQEGNIEHASLSVNGRFLVAVDSKTESQLDLSLYNTNGGLISNILISNENSEKFEEFSSITVSNDGQRIAVAIETATNDSQKDKIIIMKKNGSSWIREAAVRDSNSSSGRVWNMKFSPSSEKLIANFDYPLSATTVTCGSVNVNLGSSGRCKVGKFIKHLAVFEKNSSWEQVKMISPEDLGISRLRDFVRHVDVNVDLVPLKFNSEDSVEIYLPGSGYYDLDI